MNIKERHADTRINNMLEILLDPALFSKLLTLKVSEGETNVAEGASTVTVASVFEAPSGADISPTTVLVTATTVSSPPGATEVSVVTMVVVTCFLVSVSGAVMITGDSSTRTVVTGEVSFAGFALSFVTDSVMVITSTGGQ